MKSGSHNGSRKKKGAAMNQTKPLPPRTEERETQFQLSLQKNLLIAPVQLSVQNECHYQFASPWNEVTTMSLPFENGPVPGRGSIQGRKSESQENSLQVTGCYFDLILVPCLHSIL